LKYFLTVLCAGLLLAGWGEKVAKDEALKTEIETLNKSQDNWIQGSQIPGAAPNSSSGVPVGSHAPATPPQLPVPASSPFTGPNTPSRVVTREDAIQGQFEANFPELKSSPPGPTPTPEQFIEAMQPAIQQYVKGNK
jgi:hypothetical protein